MGWRPDAMKHPDGVWSKAIERIEIVCGPTQTWPGRCGVIAHAFLRERLVKGRAVVGVWTGPIAPSVPCTTMPGGVLHQWIVQRDGLVVDPTRWVFEGAAPYVYRGKADDYMSKT